MKRGAMGFSNHSDGYTDYIFKRLFGVEGERAPVLIVSAHPDDEVIGTGGLLKHLKKTRFVHITDGAPYNIRMSRARGFSTRHDYALARRDELRRALNHMPSPPLELIEFGVTDLEASYDLQHISYRLWETINRIEPAAVLTHPYEGGHPDHDSAAFCAYAALRLIEKSGRVPPPLFEYSSYHAGSNGNIETSRFLPSDISELVIKLSDEERAIKKDMFECYRTQKGSLRQFAIDEERFRPAPLYDFTEPPHPGKLFYQNYDWGMPGRGWCKLASKALKKLGIANGSSTPSLSESVYRPRLPEMFKHLMFKAQGIIAYHFSR